MMALAGTCTLIGVIGVSSVTLEACRGIAWARIKASVPPFEY